MKNLFPVFAMLLTICFFLSSCATHVRLGQKNGVIEFKHVGGYASPERGLEILEEQTYVQERQELSKAKQALYKKLAIAVSSSDEREIAKIQRMIQAVESGYSASAVKCRNLGIRNSDPNYAIRIKNGPFEGQYLSPGERTHEKRPFPTGIFSMKYEWFKVGTNSSGTNMVHISIGEYRTEDIVFQQWDN